MHSTAWADRSLWAFSCTTDSFLLSALYMEVLDNSYFNVAGGTFHEVEFQADRSAARLLLFNRNTHHQPLERFVVGCTVPDG